MTCMPSLVTSNIRLTSMAESTVRCLLFSRQRWRTRSSNDLQAIAFRINFSFSVMSRPRAKSFRSRWQSCRKFPLATDVFGRTWPPPWLDSSWLLRVLLCTLYTLSSISFSLTFCAVSPVPTWTVCQSKVKQISRPLSLTKLLLGAFAERRAEGKIHSVDKTPPILCSNLPLPNSCSASVYIAWYPSSYLPPHDPK